MEHRPVAWVDFRDAVRFCNWLHNGQPSGVQDATTTEGGAYTITAEAFANNTLVRNPGARFWIPNDDEWYKAAYHHPASAGGPPGGYWLFPTRSDFPVLSEPPPGASGSANVCCEAGLRATDVGAYVNSFSFYGGYDMAGNAHEWTETIIFVTNRRLRSGSWSYSEFYPQSTNLEFDTIDYEGDDGGFRVAGAVE
jgi:formylglycine-generating enzyme required for sulfatase activity